MALSPIKIAETDLLREEQLLLCSSRAFVDAETAERITTLLDGTIGWAYLIRMALAHGVMPLLYRTLNSVCSDAVPKPILEELREHFYANAGRNLFLAKELIKLLQLFEAHEIPAIAYKGPTLAVSIYGNLAFREFGDLDILVHERDYQTARHLLISPGFRPTIELEWEEEFTDGSGRFAVDLHKRIASRDFPSPLNFEYLSRRLQRITLAGTIVATLCPEDTLLMLSIQVTKDGNLQLSKICDMAELFRVHQHLNWVQVLKEAKRLGGERMLLYGLRLASNLLGTVLPKELVSEMSFHSALDGLVEYARRQLFHRDDCTVRDQPTADWFRWVLENASATNYVLTTALCAWT